MSLLPSSQIAVKIFNKEYQIACPQEQEDKLHKASNFLNTRIKEMKESKASMGTEQTIVATALNLAHELLEQRHEQQQQWESNDHAIQSRLQTIKNRLDVSVLQRSLKPEGLKKF